MFTVDPNGSYMMPAHFGPRQFDPRASGWYHDVTAITLSYVTDRDQLPQYVPASFEVTDEAVVTVVYANNWRVDWLAGHGYNLIGVSASVRFDGEVDCIDGQFTLVMWENPTDPILTGRELQGEPKIDVFNAMNGQVMTMAVRLVLDGHATVEQVDRAWMVDRGAPMGPFGMMDLFGLDLLRDSWCRPSDDPHREALRERIEPYFAEFVDDGRLGQKSGQGSTTIPSRPINSRPSPTPSRRRRSRRTRCSARGSRLR